MTMTPREALTKAAEICRKRAELRFEEHGFTEPDTNASYYGGANEDILESLDEEDEDCALTIEALRDSLAKEQNAAAEQPPVTPHRSMPGPGESSDSTNGAEHLRQPCETDSGDMAAPAAAPTQVGLTMNYPNLEAILDGRVSGHSTEWLMVRIELRRLFERVEATERHLTRAQGAESDLAAMLMRAEAAEIQSADLRKRLGEAFKLADNEKELRERAEQRVLQMACGERSKESEPR